MAAILPILSIILAFLSFQAIAVPASFLPRDVSPALPNQRSLQNEIGRSLSKKAALYFPGQAEYKNLTTRWAENINPNFFATVEVGTADDVATTVGSHTKSLDRPRLTLYQGQIRQEIQHRLSCHQSRPRNDEDIEHFEERHTNQPSPIARNHRRSGWQDGQTWGGSVQRQCCECIACKGQILWYVR